MDPIPAFVPVVEPTICGPVSDFQEVTRIAHDNAITLGWYGFAAGILTAAIFYAAVVYVAPIVYRYGVDHRWWS